ncbi:hypothetical protein [Rhodovulum sp. FJ3]|uniref:hypothetical protein n=1 Tax=Rhodovulum sp. FJ3 TaxID=3079053 RepID=UPI00293DA6F5|nr:hypothetical protein [Rhodovulum sp. FJ3]MDV4169609.1 hypothetical protein [Rhodovulum sp. FJ3]
MKRLFALAALIPAPALAGFERPIPQPQNDVAEFWFFVGSVALIAALVAVQMLVSRR